MEDGSVICFLLLWRELVRAFEIVYAAELDDVLKAERCLLYDIREPEEYAKGHWPMARNYPYGELEKGFGRLPKNRKIILYCEHGGTSMQMARTMGNEGYQVATVVGGYEAMEKLVKEKNGMVKISGKKI